MTTAACLDFVVEPDILIVDVQLRPGARAHTVTIMPGDVLELRSLGARRLTVGRVVKFADWGADKGGWYAYLDPGPSGHGDPSRWWLGTVTEMLSAWAGVVPG